VRWVRFRALLWNFGWSRVMSERCSWCVSPARAVAEEAIADGVEIAEVARSYGLSRDQWYKHRRHGTLISPTSLASVRLEVIEGGGGPYTVIPRLEELLLQVDGLKDRWGEKPQVTVALLRLERDILGDIAMPLEPPEPPTTEHSERAHITIVHHHPFHVHRGAAHIRHYGRVNPIPQTAHMCRHGRVEPRDRVLTSAASSISFRSISLPSTAQ
jgi:hypothetical protein